MSDTRHPKSHVSCPECGENHETWQANRRLPQVGQTYECAECGHEVHVYDAGDKGEVLKQFRPVTHNMATSLLFFDIVGEWPDQALDDLFKQGLDRMEGIDYRICEIEGLSQTEWADQTERRQPSVSENVSKAKRKLFE